MIPLRDNIPYRTFPFVNYSVIAICALVFIAQLIQPPGAPDLIERFGMIPARITHPDEPLVIRDLEVMQTPRGPQMREIMRPAADPAVPPLLTMLTCIFLHGGWMHFLGNMWFLHIFGDNVEDRFGHVGFVLFYLACGVAASLAHYWAGPNSTLPTIGASGAIAGVMGAYMYLYPHARVLTLVPIFVFLQVLMLPAPLFLGVWFLLQLFSGAMTLGAEQAAGVAWWAHIGGFAVGFAVAWLLGQAHRLNPPVAERLPASDRLSGYRLERGPRSGY
ncbi:MAG: rhomboid family intramembrane serine protease [Planctomycetaceae bacterium]